MLGRLRCDFAKDQPLDSEKCFLLFAGRSWGSTWTTMELEGMEEGRVTKNKTIRDQEQSKGRKE